MPTQESDWPDVEEAIFESFELFEEEGITENDMERIKAGLETQFYNSISSILGKGFQMARYNEYAGSPSFIEQDIANIQAVTMDDVLRVYETYVKDKHYVATSFVPKGSLDLMRRQLCKSRCGGRKHCRCNGSLPGCRRGGRRDRSLHPPPSIVRLEPAMGPDPVVTPPEVWSDELSDGIEI